MSESQNPTDPQRPAAPEYVEGVNNRSRKHPTRPGLVAALGVLTFVGGITLYMTYF